MADPLAGKREAINQGDLKPPLEWPDDGQGCPVEQGQIFVLRRCWIEITGTRRAVEDGNFVWRAGFVRHRKRRSIPIFLGRSGYVEDPDHAVSADDDPNAPTIMSVDPLDNPLNTGPPPEGEAVDPDEIEDYAGSVEARQRYQRDLAERRAAYDQLPVELRLAHLRRLARDRHVDISKEERVIERRIAALERKIIDQEAA